MSKLVLRDEDVSQIDNGQFIFCKELNKGFIKRDITGLGVVTFEDVTLAIEGLTLDELNTLGLDSVLFADGNISIGHRRDQEIKKMISELPNDSTEVFIEELQALKRSQSRYFNKNIFDEAIEKLAIPTCEVNPESNSLIPILTSNSGSNGIAFSTSPETDAFKAFNNQTGVGFLWQSNETNTGKIGYIFNNPCTVTEYEVEGYSPDNRFSLGEFNLEGSSNTTDGFDGDWIVIDSRLLQSSNYLGVVNASTFKAFRLNIFSTQGNVSNPVVSTLKLRG